MVLAGHDEFENPSNVRVLYGLPDAGLTKFLSRFELVHLHGLWHPGFHRAVAVCRKLGVPYVISPRGMLDPWALSVKRWKKRLALFLYQRADLRAASAFHVTAQLEEASVRRMGLSQPCFIAPNGVDLPMEMPPRTASAECGRHTAIFLSRLHPGKGLLTLAEAWARVNPQGWTMKVVGPDTYGHKSEVLAKLDALGISHVDLPIRTQSNYRENERSNNASWEFVDMVDDIAKWHHYRSADILIHPSVSENFGITIAEGLAAGLPVIATRGTPWKDLEDYRCGWWIDQGVNALAAALQEAVTSNERLEEMGRRGRKLVERKYTWAASGDAMIAAYKNVLQNKNCKGGHDGIQNR